MRIKIFFLAFLISCVGGISYAAVDGIVNVALHNAGGPGETGPIFPMARMFSVSPVTVTVTDDVNLDILFRSSVGAVVVAIKDEAGVVHYVKSVDTTETTSLSVDISMLPPGTYTISFTNADKTLNKYGTFEVN
ncbi:MULTISPECIES: DUF3244 domain-containing protein [unclassified Dysgonomonas]|uniref:DUF3244 domain-containing protein n=1 Tax=unclassified Dysgonomonas TaxID=2630389 RepID=UPI0025C12B46|nr:MULTISPECIES: DUF3244 domain-containing protein [unclassified Dysgonomonas]HMM01935.1 DUF3244 domain-containing protein [Dysgonomonas sp.]